MRISKGILSFEIPCAPRTGGGQDARPAQKSETRLALHAIKSFESV